MSAQHEQEEHNGPTDAAGHCRSRYGAATARQGNRGPQAQHIEDGRELSLPPTSIDYEKRIVMTIQNAATPSISTLDPWRDMTVHVTFRTVDPINSTEIVVDPYPSDDGCLLQLLDVTITRLRAYREALIEAEEEDREPLPASARPVPRHAWGR